MVLTLVDPAQPTLTVVMPVFNESATLATCLERVLQLSSDDLKLEVIVVDDGSTDDSVDIAESFVQSHSQVRLLKNEVNQGKGAALRLGFAHARGDFVAIQDADLEYDPRDLLQLLEPLLLGHSDAAFGRRTFSNATRSGVGVLQWLSNRGLTWLSNRFTGLGLTDVETCYKVFRRDFLDDFHIQESGFGFEPEVVAALGRRKARITEFDISYKPRGYAEGKKIKPKDGLHAIYCIVRYGASAASTWVQFVSYAAVAALALVLHVALFLTANEIGLDPALAFGLAGISAAILDYSLCTKVLFADYRPWANTWEQAFFTITIVVEIALAWLCYESLIASGIDALWSMPIVAAARLVPAFVVRRYVVFGRP